MSQDRMNQQVAHEPRQVRVQRRTRAVAAALAAGGLASLGVVLLGAPTDTAPPTVPVVAVPAVEGAQPVRRADVTLGEGL